MKRALLAWWLASASCGDPLVGGDFRGEPIGQVRGDIAPQAEDDLFVNLRVGLFWLPMDLHAAQLPQALDDPAASLLLTGPGEFSFNLFAPPDATHLLPGGRFGISRLLLYRDRDHDGRRNGAEPLLGAAAGEAVVYAATALSAAESPTGRALPAGVHQVVLPLLCGQPAPPPGNGGACGVPLGDACDDDHACGTAGRCLRRLPLPAVNGVCVLPEPNDAQCRPSTAAFMPTRFFPGWQGLWVRACRQDADCARPSDSGKPLYRCDVAAGGCVPRLPMHVDVGADFPLAPVCADGPPTDR